MAFMGEMFPQSQGYKCWQMAVRWPTLKDEGTNSTCYRFKCINGQCGKGSVEVLKLLGPRQLCDGTQLTRHGLGEGASSLKL